MDDSIVIPSRNSDSRRETFAHYTTHAKRKPSLTKEEEKNLSLRYKKGCIISRDKLIEHNLPLIFVIVARYFRHITLFEFDDLVQTGTEGLILATKDFDHTKGRFTTHAGKKIKYAIFHALTEKSRMVKIPTWLQNKQRKLRRDLQTATGKELASVQEALRKILLVTSFPMISLDETFHSENGEDVLLSETLIDENVLDPSMIICAKETLIHVKRQLRILLSKLWKDPAIQEWEIEVFLLYSGLAPDTDPLSPQEITKKRHIGINEVRYALKRIQKFLQTTLGKTVTVTTIREARELATLLCEVAPEKTPFTIWE